MYDDDDDDKTSIRPLSDLMESVVESKQTAYLIVLSGKAVGKMFKMGQGDMLIGRSAACDILLDDDGVSRKHARLVCKDDGSVHLLDLGSTNGTWVEGQQVDIKKLNDGDRLQIGSATILKYSYQNNVETKFVEQLYESATQDGLTGIYNKRYFLNQLEHEFAWHRRHTRPLTLILFDIDFFKHINDTFGHQPGDFVLAQMARVCVAQCRTEDVLARYGGEEFAVILRETSAMEGNILAERIRRAIESTLFEYSKDGGTIVIPVTVSLGVAALDGDMTEPKNLVEAADRYLYKSKQGGRNRVSSQAFDT